MKKILFSILLIIVLVALFLIPKESWKKMVALKNNSANFAAVFTSSNIGNWNDPTTWGLSGNDPLTSPGGISISPSTGKIYANTFSGSDIVVLNADLSFSTRMNPFGGYGCIMANAISPLTENIYFTDCSNSNITVLNPDLSFSTSTNPASIFDGLTLNSPAGIAVSSTGKIYVADLNNQRIVVLNPDLSFSTSTSQSTEYDGLMLHPVAIAISSLTGDIYIGDSSNNRIVVLNPDLSFSTSTNPATTYDGLALSWPSGIALSSTGNIYITDGNNSRVVILNPDLSFSTSSNPGLADFFPQAIAISSSGQVYMGDANSNGFVVLNSDLSFLSTSTYSSYARIEGTDFPGLSDDVTITNGQTVTLTNDQSVNSIELETGGTLNLNGYTLNVYGDWTNSGGTLANSSSTASSTVNFSSTSAQRILGTNTFENLIKNSSTTSSLLFDPTATTTITGILNLSGSVENLLSIGPSSGSVSPIFDYSIGTSSVYLSGFSQPNAIAVHSDKIYVADTQNNRIVVLNSDGTTFAIYDGIYDGVSLNHPIGLTVSSNGTIYIADSGRNRIVVLNSDGTYSASYTGDPETPLSTPTGVKISPLSGEIYIADLANSRIAVLSSNGVYLRAIQPFSPFYPYAIDFAPTGEIYVAEGGDSSRTTFLNSDETLATSTLGKELSPIAPTGVKYFDGKIYVTDSNNHNRIVMFNSDGSLSSSTPYNSDIFPFDQPAGIDISSSGEIYVADTNNNRIVVLNQDGSASSTYSHNKIPGLFLDPIGIAHDSSGNVYVSDDIMNNVQEFGSDGHFVKFITRPYGFENPQSMSVDAHDNLYVTDYGDENQKGRISRFNSSGVYATSSPSLTITGGVVADSSGNIYYSSYDLNNDNSYVRGIVKLDSTFHISTTTDSANGMSFDVNYGGTVIDPTGDFLYVADDYHNRIVKLNTSDLSFVSESFGPGGVSFSVPTDIKMDSIGNLYVTNQGYPNVMKLSPDYVFLSQWGTSGSDNGQFSNLSQLTIDSEDNIYVTDSGNYRVQKFIQSPFTPFNIIYTGSTIPTLSYLSVSSATNQSATSFDCTNNCVNVGSNTNWVFSAPVISTTPIHHRSRSIPASNSAQIFPSESHIGSTSTVSTTTVSIATTSATSTIPGIDQKVFVFEKNLKQYQTDPDVHELQRFLNTHDFVLATSSYGSPGHETDYFGALTRKSVVRFQEAYTDDILKPYGLTKGTGYFFERSRAKANEILNQK